MLAVAGCGGSTPTAKTTPTTSATTAAPTTALPTAGPPPSTMAPAVHCDSGQYAFSPDGRSMTYLDTNAWHLVTSSGNRVLSTLPAAPGRGISVNQDDSFLGFSPDGLYVGYFQTFHVGGTGQTAPGQIR